MISLHKNVGERIDPAAGERWRVCPTYGLVMAFRTPIEAALAAESASPETRVLAFAESGNVAAVLLDSPSWPAPDLVLCERRDDGWSESGTTSGGTSWLMDDSELTGSLVCLAEAPPGSTSVTITQLGRTIERPVENGYVVWVLTQVMPEDWNALAQLDWV